MFLVSGEGKAGALREILEGDADPRAYPAKLVNPVSGDLTWMVDQAAAGSLTPPLGPSENRSITPLQGVWLRQGVDHALT